MGLRDVFFLTKRPILLIILLFWGNDEGSEPGNGFSAVQFGSSQHPPDPHSSSTPYPSPCSLHPASSTLYPSSFILPLPISHPPPFIPHPSPFIPPLLLPPPPASFTPYLVPFTPQPTSSTLYPLPFTLRPILPPFPLHPSPACSGTNMAGGARRGAKPQGKGVWEGKGAEQGLGLALTRLCHGAVPCWDPGQGSQSLLNPLGACCGAPTLPGCLGGCFGCWVPSFRGSS